MAEKGEQITGNTSTSVEKTHPLFCQYLKIEKHLHERGEDASCGKVQDQTTETPPRAWRRHHYIVKEQINNTISSVF